MLKIVGCDATCMTICIACIQPDFNSSSGLATVMFQCIQVSQYTNRYNFTFLLISLSVSDNEAEKKTKKAAQSSNEELSEHDSEYERSKKKTPRETTSDDDEETPRKKKRRSYKKKPVSAGDCYSDSN